VEEVAVHLRTFLTDLNDAFGFDTDVSIDDSEEGTLIGRFEGRHGLLVGPKGRTLDAIQELARISCQRTVPSTVRIKVDVADYRAQRAEKLAGFAQSAADKAAGDGVEVALEPMSPADRKIIHDALNGDDRVETRSVGTEPRRKVLVVPLVDADADLDDDDTDQDDAVDETTE
jgi:spoIIIJ-associated protein